MKGGINTGKRKVVDFKNPFAERLRLLIGIESASRAEIAATRKALSEVIGKTTQSITNYESGEAFPDYENLGKIADYFGVSCDYLLGRSDTRSPADDIKTACYTTGLSEETISIFNAAKKGGIIDKYYFWNSEDGQHPLLAFIDSIISEEHYRTRIVNGLSHIEALRSCLPGDYPSEEELKVPFSDAISGIAYKISQAVFEAVEDSI